MSNGIRHGQPDVSRNDKWEHDKYVWPDGLELFIYDDGRVKVGRWNASVVVEHVRNYPAGRSERPNGWVEVRFTEKRRES